MWVNRITDLKTSSSDKMADWMQKPMNLGAELRKVCKQLTLQVINQAFDIPFDDEYEILQLSKDHADCFVRKILLVGDDVPFTYGRVVVPKVVYLNHQDKFTALGNKLIGETLLYSNPNTVRSTFEFNQIDKLHPLFASVTTALPEKSVILPSFLARRSIFQLNATERLLITEVFLIDLPEISY